MLYIFVVILIYSQGQTFYLSSSFSFAMCYSKIIFFTFVIDVKNNLTFHKHLNEKSAEHMYYNENIIVTVTTKEGGDVSFLVNYDWKNNDYKWHFLRIIQTN